MLGFPPISSHTLYFFAHPQTATLSGEETWTLLSVRAQLVGPQVSFNIAECTMVRNKMTACVRSVFGPTLEHVSHDLIFL